MTPRTSGWRRPSFWTIISGLLVAALLVVAVRRFSSGLGAVTHLSDALPWGLWVGFDVLCGVGLAAGGFVVTATVHVLHLETYRPVVRPAVLTAFLGYLLVILSLLFDLGRPWNIWRVLTTWNPRSVMFEVGWCVVLYTIVLFLEFAPVVLERLKRPSRPLSLLRRASPALVIIGVILSTLHQSSLGSLFLIIPDKMHPLWYTPLLPVLFFASAVAAGLSMTVVESWYSQRALGRPLERRILDGLSRAQVVVLAIYIALRLRDLVVRGALRALWRASLTTLTMGLELVGGALLPAALLASARFRASPRRLTAAHGLVLLGFILHRLNVSITAVEAATSQRYLPSLEEVLVSAGLVAVGIQVFRWACRHLPVFPPARSSPPA